MVKKGEVEITPEVKWIATPAAPGLLTEDRPTTTSHSQRKEGDKETVEITKSIEEQAGLGNGTEKMDKQRKGKSAQSA